MGPLAMHFVGKWAAGYPRDGYFLHVQVIRTVIPAAAGIHPLFHDAQVRGRNTRRPVRPDACPCRVHQEQHRLGQYLTGHVTILLVTRVASVARVQADKGPSLSGAVEESTCTRIEDVVPQRLTSD